MKSIKREDLSKEYQAIIANEINFPAEYIAHGYYCWCNWGGYLITLSNDGNACFIVSDLGGDTVTISDILEIEYREGLENEDEENNLSAGFELDGAFFELQYFIKI